MSLFSFFFSFSFRSLIYQLQELVESRCNNDLCTAVALFTQFRIIVCDRIVLTTSGSRKPFRVNTIFILQFLYYR